MGVAGDELVRGEGLEEVVEQVQVLPSFDRIGPRFVVVSREEHGDGNAVHGISGKRPADGRLPALFVPLLRPTRRPWRAQVGDAQSPKVLFDGEGDRGFRSGRSSGPGSRAPASMSQRMIVRRL